MSFNTIYLACYLVTIFVLVCIIFFQCIDCNYFLFIKKAFRFRFTKNVVLNYHQIQLKISTTVFKLYKGKFWKQKKIRMKTSKIFHFSHPENGREFDRVHFQATLKKSSPPRTRKNSVSTHQRHPRTKSKGCVNRDFIFYLCLRFHSHSRGWLRVWNAVDFNPLRAEIQIFN